LQLATQMLKSRPREAVKAFNNADWTIFFAGPDKKLKIIHFHGLTDFGNTIIRPDSKVGGHTGMNGVPFVGLVNTIITYDTPTGGELPAWSHHWKLRGECLRRSPVCANEQSSKVGRLVPSNSFSRLGRLTWSTLPTWTPPS